MSDLISRSALLNTIPNVRRVVEYDEGGWGMTYNAVPVEAIETAPAVDAVEVVRCKDCEYRGDAYECPMYVAHWHCEDEDRTSDYGFCECGVRKEVNPNEGEGTDRSA